MSIRTSAAAPLSKVTAARHRFYQGPTSLQHYVRSPTSNGGAPLDEFVSMVRRVGNSVSRMQKDWIGGSNDGVLWGMAGGHSDFSDRTGFMVRMKLKPERRGFYDYWNKGDVAAWKAWATPANLKRPSVFTKYQTDELKANGWPSHSAFYKDNGLAGVVWRYRKGIDVEEPAHASTTGTTSPSTSSMQAPSRRCPSRATGEEAPRTRRFLKERQSSTTSSSGATPTTFTEP